MVKKIIHAIAQGEYVFVVIFTVALILLRALKFIPAETVAINFWQFVSTMITVLPAMFIMVGLFDVWVPKEKVARHVGAGSGLKGIAAVVLLASLQGGPLYGAFPVAYILWKKGASPRNIFIYLGSFATIKISMLTFEMGFLGVKFSLVRTAFTLPVYIVIGFIMEKYFGKDFRMYSQGENQNNKVNSISDSINTPQ